MFRRLLFLFPFAFIFIITACSSQNVQPDEALTTYLEYWNKQDFTKMYDMLSTETKETYSKEKFTERYEKVYKDIEVKKLDVSFDPLTDEELKAARKEQNATFPLKVNMETIAGEVSFTYDVTLVQEEKDDGKKWSVNWNPGLIFPELADGGEIAISVQRPRRGEILDCNRMPLAINDVVYEIGIVPERFTNEAQEKEEVARLLNMSVKKIDKALNAGWVEPHLFVPLKNVPKDKEDILAQLRNIPAVEQRETMGRTYPAGKAAAHLVGYVGKITAEELEKKDPGIYEPSDMIGKRGLEQLYEEQLKGEKGAKVTIKKEDEEIVLAEKKAKNGENIIVTIDVNIQEKIYDAYDGKAGTAAAINPKTGETLALVSSPAFNPNDFVYGISQTEWDNLENDPLQPMINRFASTYAPGSVMKPITAAIGLSNGTIKPEEGITINGLTWSGGEGWGDYKVRRVSTSSQPVDLADALIRSDNIYFAMKAVEMGNEKYIEGLKKFGFGEKLPYSYPMTNSSISNDGKLSDDVLLANTSYGQGQIEMSSLHLAVTYTPFLNDGNMIKPTLLASEKTGEIWHENIISPEQAETMQEDLRAVVTKGTAKAAQKASFPISGKTGTAELKSSSKAKGRENGWFVGYPTDDQDILIAMMMENVQDVGASGFVTEKVTEILSDVKIKED